MMRRTILFALMISLVLLGGCGGAAARDGERIEALRAELATAAAVHFTAELTADDGETVAAYTLDCTRADGETCMTLRAPELIAGVTARLRAGDAVLTFDGLALEAGAMDAEGLTPIAAPAAVLDALEKGVVSQLRRESLETGETVAFRVLCSETTDADLWLDGETLTPLYAELISGGRTVIACRITDWSIEREG